MQVIRKVKKFLLPTRTDSHNEQVTEYPDDSLRMNTPMIDRTNWRRLRLFINSLGSIIFRVQYQIQRAEISGVVCPTAGPNFIIESHVGAGTKRLPEDVCR
jgi:hypothetical protein